MTYAIAQRSGGAHLSLSGLGQAPSVPSDPRDVTNIVPPECANIAHYTMPPNDVPAGRVLVLVFPFVRKSPDRMGAVLAQILGASGQGGPVLTRLIDLGRAYQFVAGGWIRDEVSNQATTKGYLWLALAPRGASTVGTLRNDAKRLISQALQAEGLPFYGAPGATSSASDSTVDLLAVWTSIASGESDQELLEAVYRAAGGAAEFGSFVRFIVAAGRAGSQAARLTQAFVTQTEQLLAAVRAVAGVESLAGEVHGNIQQALAMAKDQQAQAAALLNAAKGKVESASALIRAAATGAPSFVQQATTQRETILTAVRRAILDTVEADIQRGSPFEMAREYLRCAMLNYAKGSVSDAVARTDRAIIDAAGAAQWLINNGPAIQAAQERLNQLRIDLDDAFAQLPLGFWLRERWGLPTWGWGVVGAGVFIGGAFGIRALRKRGER